MPKYTALIPEELQKISAIIVSRSELEYVIGMLEGLSWGAPEPYSDAICAVIGRLEDMTGGN